MASVELFSGVVLLAGVVVGLLCLPLPSARRLIHVSIRVRVAPRTKTDGHPPAWLARKAGEPRCAEPRRVPRRPRGTGTQLALLRAQTAMELASGSRWG